MTNQQANTRYVIVLQLPRTAEIAIEDHYLNLAGLSRPAMGYHITLLGPFLIDQDQITDISAALNALADLLQPTSIIVDGVGAFSNNGSHTLYLDVKPTSSLLALRAKLWSVIGHGLSFTNDRVLAYNQPANFHPHITLGLGITDDELAAFARTQTEPFQLSFVAAQIVLLSQYRDGPWEPECSSRLGQALPPTGADAEY